MALSLSFYKYCEIFPVSFISSVNTFANFYLETTINFPLRALDHSVAYAYPANISSSLFLVFTASLACR